MGRAYVYACTRCGSGHNRVAEGAKSLPDSSSSPLLWFCLLCHETPQSSTQNVFVSPLAFSHHVHLWINQSKIRTCCVHISRTSLLIGLYINLIYYIDHFHHTVQHHTTFNIYTITLHYSYRSFCKLTIDLDIFFNK